jgi:DNA topoisomerase I
VSYEFTASMEDVLDEIAAGRRDKVSELAEFYFGSADIEGLQKAVSELGEIDARELATFPVGSPDTGVNLRVGRYGPYVEDADGNRGNVPEDLPPDELTVEKARELLANPAGLERELGRDPASGNTVVAKNGRYGPYVTEVLPEGAPKSAKPRTSSLFKEMSLEAVTLDDALRLLTLPRVVGVDPADGEEITAQNGRYGPYLKKGTDSRTLPSEEQLLTITLDEALAVYAQPKQRGRSAASAGRELGADPATGATVTVKAGRFGTYVTDGEYNATIPRAEDAEQITLERAAELLAERRAKGPAKTAKKAPAKKATAKKATAKKATAKKSAAKTATGKKATSTTTAGS